jgi:hypothetical protein
MEVSNIYNDINDLRKKLKKDRFENEYNDIDDENRMRQLKVAIEKIDEKNDIDDIHKMLTKVNKLVYQKLWNKLKPFQKIDKMIEYIDEYEDMDNKEEIKEKLKVLINNNKLKNVKNCQIVNYDTTNTKIISISIVDKDENDKYYVKI